MTRGPNQDPELGRSSGSGDTGSAASDDGAYGTYFLGRYRVVDEIGVGGMASVHLARMDGAGGFQKWVAIKKIHPHLIEDEQFIHMFLDEARIAARISHPNVAQVFDLGVHENTYWIAMEYLHGEPLREIMRWNEDNGLATRPELAARMVADAAEGLHAAHELRGKNGEPLNLVHRDVSPHNLFVTYEGMVKVVDFGIAKVSGRLSSTRAGTLKGKLAYMSPEQVRGSAIDRRTDIFALGVVLWELTTGQRLFRMDSDLETLEKVQACVVPPPSSLRPDYPAELESVVMRALQRRADTRYQTARELSRALQQYLMHAGQFVGPEECASYVTGIFGDRIRKREAHLRWAAEVTQTISLDSIRESAVQAYDEISMNSYESVSNDGEPRSSGGSAVTARPPRAKAPAVAQAPAIRSAAEPDYAQPAPAPGPARLPPPAHGIHMPAPRVRPDLAAQPKSSVVITTTPPSSPNMPYQGGYNEDDEEEDIATIVVPSRLVLDQVPSAPLPAAGAPVPVGHHAAAAPPQAAPQQQVAYPPQAGGYPPQQGTPVGQPTSAAMAAQHPPQPMNPMMQPAPQMDQSPQAWPNFYPPGVLPPRIDETMQLPAARQNHMVVYIAAAVGTFFVVVGLAAVILLRSRAESRAQVAASATAEPAQTTAAATTTTAPTATAAPTQPPQPSTAAATTSTAPPPATTTAPPATPPPPATVAKAPPATTKTGAPPPTNEPPAATGGSTGKAEPGYLTVVCSPFCDSVSAGGRNLGPSPVVHVALPPGQYRVVLKRTGGSTKVVPAVIVSGQVTSQRVSMD